MTLIANTDEVWKLSQNKALAVYMFDATSRNQWVVSYYVERIKL